MKKVPVIVSLALFTLIFSLLPLRAADGWTLIKESDGIKLFERPVAGTELMEYMGVSTINAKMEVIGEVLRDVSSYNLWLADCKGAQVQKQISRNDMIIYMVLEPPVIDDRDLILKDKAVYDYDGGKAVISFTISDEVKIPVQQGRIRVVNLTGFFDMEYLGRDRTKFSYRLKVDPAGDINKKVAYGVMKTYPLDTIRGLKKMIGDKKYQTIARGTEEEKQIDNRAKNEAFQRKLLSNRLSGFVKNKGVMTGIVASDKQVMSAVMGSAVSGASVMKATIDFFMMYAEKTAGKPAADKLAKNSDFIAALNTLVETSCGAESASVDSLISAYKDK